MEDKFSSLLKRLEAVTTKLEGMEAPTAGAPPAGARAAPAAPVENDRPTPMVLAFDDFLNGAVAAYVAAAGKIDMPEVRAAPRPAARARSSPALAAQLIAGLSLSTCRPPSKRGW